MQNPRLAGRYAKSLMDLAIEKNSLEPVHEDMKLLDKICTLSKDFVLMLNSPIISNEKKIAIIKEIVTGHVGELTNVFIQLLITKGRAVSMPEIVTAFISRYNEIKKIKTVNVISATDLDENARNIIISKISQFLDGYTVDLKVEINKDLIGGFIIAIDDKMYDASVKKSLADIKSAIVDYSYVSKLFETTHFV